MMSEQGQAPLTPIQKWLRILLIVVMYMSFFCVLAPWLPIPQTLRILCLMAFILDGWGQLLFIPYLLLCLLFLFAAFSVRKWKACLPVFLLVYLCADLIFYSLSNTVLGLIDDYQDVGTNLMLVSSTLVTLALVILLVLYLRERAKVKRGEEAITAEMGAAS